MTFTFQGVEFPLNGPPNGFGTGEGWTVTGDPPILKSPTGEVVAVASLGEPSVEGVTDPFAASGGQTFAYRLQPGTASRTLIVQAKEGQQGDILLVTGPPTDDDPLGLSTIYMKVGPDGQVYFSSPPALWNQTAGEWVTLPVPEPAP